MNLLTRVARLERSAPRGDGTCAECGGRPGPRSYRLEFETPGERRDGPERCPACARRLVFRLEFDRQG